MPSVTQSGFFDRSFDIHDAVPGNYKIQVWAINPISGAMSVSTILYYDYHSTAATSTLLPPTNAYVVGTLGQTWSGRDLQFYWVDNSANVTATDKLSKYIIEVWDNANTNILQTISVAPNKENAETTGEFTLTLEHNIALFTNPNPSVNFKIFCEDLVGNRSTARAVTFTNPAPVIDGFITTAGFGYVALKAVVNNYGDIISFTYRKYASADSATALETATITANTYDFPATAGTEYWYTVQANDHYRSGAETTRSNATTVPIDADTYTYTGLQFTPNSPAANFVSWSAFDAIKNGTTSVTVNAGNAQWTADTLYLYYVPGDSTFKSTTSSSTAIAAGGRILATYKGGTNLTADAGKAFIDGDQIIAGSLLANALNTNTAYITNMAMVGNIIQSDNYSNSSGNYSGWRIDKQGAANFNSISVRDSLGNLIFSSGTGMEWSAVTGTGKPADYADVTNYSDTRVANSLLLANSSFNLITDNSLSNPSWWGFGSNTLPSGWTTNTATQADQPQRFFIKSSGGGDFDYWSTHFQVANNTQYRVKLSMFISNDFTGLIAPLVHFPGITWALPGSPVNDPNSAFPYGHTAASWGSGAWHTLETIVTASSQADLNWLQTRICGRVTTGYCGFFIEVTSLFGGAGQITSSNASTYIANAAIGSAQIGDATITNAKVQDAAITNAKIDRASVNKLQVVTADIVDANVSTLKIAGNAVTFPVSTDGTGTISLTVTTANYPIGTQLYILGTCDFTIALDSNAHTMGMYRDGIQIATRTARQQITFSGSVAVFPTAISKTVQMTSESHTFDIRNINGTSITNCSLVIIGMKR